MIQYDLFRLERVTYCENLPINLPLYQDPSRNFVLRQVIQYNTQLTAKKTYPQFYKKGSIV